MNDDDLRRAFDDLLEPLPPLGGLPGRTARRAVRRRQVKLGAAGAGGAGVLVLVAALVATTGSGGGGDEELRPAPFASTSSSPSPGPTDEPVLEPTTDPSADPSGDPSPNPTPAAPSTPSPGATGMPAAPPVSAEPAAIRVVLRPDGLGFTDGGSSSSSLAFGSDADTVKAAVDRALGQGGDFATPDCGADVVTRQYDGLFLLLDGDRFVGWVTGSPGLTTGDGIGVGATLAELRAAYPDLSVRESTLGVEWAAAGDGGVFGFLEGSAETSRTTTVLAGQACLAR